MQYNPMQYNPIKELAFQMLQVRKSDNEDTRKHLSKIMKEQLTPMCWEDWPMKAYNMARRNECVYDRISSPHNMDFLISRD